MNQSPISILPEMERFVDERKRIRLSYQKALEGSKKLAQLAAQVDASNAPLLSARPIPPLTNEAVPSQEIEAVLPRIEQEIASARQIEQQIQAEQAAIEEIQRKAKTLMTTLIVGGVVAAIIIVLILLISTHVI
jgi:hypothetical protein